MPPIRRGRLERSPARQSTGFAQRRHVLPRPSNADELAAQLRELIPHAGDCRWSTRPYRQPGVPLAQTETARCTCTAIPHRKHLTDLITAAATGDLPTAVTRS